MVGLGDTVNGPSESCWGLEKEVILDPIKIFKSNRRALNKRYANLRSGLGVALDAKTYSYIHLGDPVLFYYF